MNGPDHTFLGVSELAARYDVPEPTVHAWLYEGTAPPSLKVGKYRRFRLSDVLAWESERMKEATDAVA
jgi:predicted DNA-binding transcriptional regulator AlpA